MPLTADKNITVHEYRDNSLTEKTIEFSAEYPITLMINGNPYMTFACSGTELESYAWGYLTTEGIISNPDEIRNIDIDESNLSINVNLIDSSEISAGLEFIKTLSAAGGRSRKKLPDKSFIRKNLPCVLPDSVLKCMSEFLAYSRENGSTHGVHSAALYTLEGIMIVFFDEIGRHNAIDKTIGYAVMNKISLEDKMIFSTGRLSSEIAIKIINARAPVLVTRASPTTYSVKLLREYNILAITTVSDERFFVINGNRYFAI